jgi:hypothetical protein
MGLVEEERNYVIARQGAIARIRDTLAGSTSRFLIDALIFPGTSGGPVVTRPEAMTIGRTMRALGRNMRACLDWMSSEGRRG